MTLLIWAKTLYFAWKEERLVRKRFYTNELFCRLDKSLKKRYRWKNAYTMSRKAMQQRGESQIHVYGETPLTTMAKIVEVCSLGPEDRLIEMGSGRGRVALFLAAFVGCTVRGYEELAVFVERFAGEGARVKMHLGKMEEADFAWATVVYLYGTLLEPEQIKSLCRKFPKGIKIITVSYALREYDGEYETLHVIEGSFPWGRTEIYVNRRL